MKKAEQFIHYILHVDRFTTKYRNLFIKILYLLTRVLIVNIHTWHMQATKPLDVTIKCHHFETFTSNPNFWNHTWNPNYSVMKTVNTHKILEPLINFNHVGVVLECDFCLVLVLDSRFSPNPSSHSWIHLPEMQFLPYSSSVSSISKNQK